MKYIPYIKSGKLKIDGLENMQFCAEKKKIVNVGRVLVTKEI